MELLAPMEFRENCQESEASPSPMAPVKHETDQHRTTHNQYSTILVVENKKAELVVIAHNLPPFSLQHQLVHALNLNEQYTEGFSTCHVQEGECPDGLDPQNPVYAEETSPSAIVNGFSERLRPATFRESGWIASLFSPSPTGLGAQTIREGMNKWDLLKLRSFCKAKDTVSKTKRLPSDWEKIFTNPSSDKEVPDWFAAARAQREQESREARVPYWTQKPAVQLHVAKAV
ncbi:hypothetical protein U0070_009911 [Myodes glareolus]|uniref:Uncharacterized protein n=1 Tax=Myodes glareolus TaxID=447135 RepID=A0AAW0JHQ3_MYOGA